MTINITVNARRIALAACALWLAGCADVPEARLPPHVDLDLRATYVLHDDAGIVVPFSSADLTVYALEVSPLPARESFAHGQRRLVFAPGTGAVEVRCRCRMYGDGGDVVRMFPGAARITQVGLEPGARN